jgi:hypothetical protein
MLHVNGTALAFDEDLIPSPDANWPAQPSEAAFHGLAGKLVRIHEPVTEGDPVALLIQTLASVGNIIGATPHRTADGAKHGLNLYAVLVGPTGGRKGSAERRVWNVMERIDSGWGHNCVISGLSTGEGLINRVKDDGVDEEGDVIKGCSDKRLYVVESEFSTILVRGGRKDNTLSGVLRQFWERDWAAVHTRKEPLTAHGVHLSLVGHIVPEELVRLLPTLEMANGAANRYMYFLVRRFRALPFPGEPDRSELNRVIMGIRNAIDCARRFGEFQFDREAKELWSDLYRKNAKRVRHGMAAGMLARLDPHRLRLACIYAALDCSETISTVHLQAAKALTDYYEKSVQYIFGDLTGIPDCDAIMGALRSQPAGLTKNDLLNLFSRNLPAARIDMALNTLLGMKLVGRKQVPTGGRPAERWFAIKTEEE